MKLDEIIENVLHASFPTQRAMASTLLRFQEHYESPVFRGRIFSRDEFKRWYVAHSPGGKKTGKFTYYEDWDGFNIPSHAFEPFFRGAFDPLSRQEMSLLDRLQDRRGTRFAVIGTHDVEDAETLQHEIAHGLFCTDDGYHAQVLAVLGAIPAEERKKITGYLASSGGYHPSVFDDETHAYVLADLDEELKGVCNRKKLRPIQRSLQRLYETYFQRHAL